MSTKLALHSVELSRMRHHVNQIAELRADIGKHQQKLHECITKAFPLGCQVTRKTVAGLWVVVRHPVAYGNTDVLLAKLGGHDNSAEEVSAITRR